MVRALLSLSIATALLAGSSATAGGGGGARTLTPGGRVVSIAADGRTVAVHAAGSSCDHGMLWLPMRRKVVALRDRPCGSRAPDAEYDGLALAAGAAAWVDYDYGNHAYCVGPFAATRAKPQAVDLGRCGPDSQDVYWELQGSGRLLVARSYLRCEDDCGPTYDFTRDVDVTLWRIRAGHVTKLATEADDTKLLDVDAGRILVRLADGTLRVLDATGRTVVDLPAAPGGARFAGSATVVVAKGGTLTAYAVADGSAGQTLSLAGGAHLQDGENGAVAYLAGRDVHLVDLASGRDQVIATQRGLVSADLEPAGLFYAYNLPGGGRDPGRVAFVPSG